MQFIWRSTILWSLDPSGGRVSQWEMENGSLVKARSRMLSPLIGD